MLVLVHNIINCRDYLLDVKVVRPFRSIQKVKSNTLWYEMNNKYCGKRFYIDIILFLLTKITKFKGHFYV